MENKVLLKSRLQIPWLKNTLYGLVVQAFLLMIHSNLWYTPDKNIWKKDLHAADLILYLVSKRNKLIKNQQQPVGNA